MSKKFVLLLWGIFCICFGALQYWRTQVPHPWVILVTIDSLNKYHLASYGYPQQTTPFLDQLQTKSLFFEQAITPCPQSLPAHTSLFTGLLPYEHGVRLNESHFLSPKYETLAEKFLEKGYFTQALLSSPLLHPKHLLSQGFSSYQILDHSASSLVQKSISLLQSRTGKTFLWLQLSDLHYPYSSDINDPSLPSNTAYHRSLQQVDSALQELEHFLNQPGNPPFLLTIVGVHGEGLGAQNEQESGFLVSRSTLDVPLFIFSKKFSPQHISAPVSLTDLAPTLYSLSTHDPLKLPDSPSSTNLSPYLNQQKEWPQRWLYFENLYPHLAWGYAPFYGFQNNQWTWIQTNTSALYRNSDLSESENLASQETPLVSQLTQKLQQLFQENVYEAFSSLHPEARHFFLTSFKKEKYTWPSPLKDPKTQLGAYLEWKKNQPLIRTQLESYLTKMQELEPFFSQAYFFYQKIVEAGFTQKETLSPIRQIFLQNAIASLSRLDPNHPFSIYYQGLLLYNQKKFTEALEIFTKILYTYPEEPECNFLVGTIFFYQKNRQAVHFLKRYLRLASPNPNTELAQKMLQAFQHIDSKQDE